ncbi:PAS domain S-box protein [Granulosicoccus antarcticus]|uniref:histidine kinase n=1 Tax=Granulosicoccus antarcticus IMCC3135 TaxID=1192854 RepID=A0A2Z2NZH5_9GAMM|nr:PAS domain S-box protein [Granulosicoccus antarcticus]ASJ76842.1 Blue-light-activated protein [Granulosicoccus antarcticus IMCC3135]
MSIVKGKSSISTFISLLVLGAGFFLLAVYLTLSYGYQKAQFRQSSENRLNFIGPRIIQVTQQLITLDARDGLDQEMQSMQKLPGVGLIAIVDQNNKILYSTDTSLRGQSLDSTDLAIAADLIAKPEDGINQTVYQRGALQQMLGVFGYSKPDARSSNISHLVISLNMQRTYQSLRLALLSQALIIGLLLIVVASIVWYLLQRVVIKPLQEIIATTRAIAEGDFTVRSHLSVNNELGEISATLDSLAQSSLEQVDAQNTQRRLSQVVNSMVDEVIVCDAETFEVINTNKAAQTNLRYSDAELVGMKPWQFVENHSYASMSNFLDPLLDGLIDHISCESLHIRKDGTTYPVRASMQYMEHQTPPVLVAISQDLSELRTQELHAQLCERAMDAVSEGIIITDAGQSTRTMVYVNQAVCDMSGFSLDELLGKSTQMLRTSNGNQIAFSKIADAIKKAESIEVQIDALKKDGSAYVTEVSMSPVFNTLGELTNYIGIHRDVTQKLLTEEKLNQAQKIKAIGHLSGGVAHDFNNLLSVIVGNLELLKTGALDKAQLARIEGAEVAAHMGAHLTRRLLSFASQQKLAPIVTNVNDHVRNAAALLAPTIGETITLTENLATDLWSTLSDPGEVETAVINLTINARDAMSQGGTITFITANITLDAQSMDGALDIEPGEYVRLCVMDNGPGISEAVKARIFEPFFTTKQDSEGSGLGLASVFGFAKQSGGCVEVSSSVGEGTVVSIYLPRHLSEDAGLHKSPGTLDEPYHSFSDSTVLVVEDKAMVRELTVHQLQSLGFTTLEVENGVKAIELLESGVEVSIVFSDIIMPGGMDGYDVAQWVKENRPQCRMLLTSGFNGPADWQEGNTEVTDLHVLQKPYRLDDLRNALHETLK